MNGHKRPTAPALYALFALMTGCSAPTEPLPAPTTAPQAALASGESSSDGENQRRPLAPLVRTASKSFSRQTPHGLCLGYRWHRTAPLSIVRDDPKVVPLLDGRVLVFGDTDVLPELAKAEVYDPSIRTWQITGSPSGPRSFAFANATRLGDGRVLVAGGWSGWSTDYSGNYVLSNAEIYDPATGQWQPTDSMNVGRLVAAGILLQDGRVLVAGGSLGGVQHLATAELYDPSTGTWTPTGTMAFARPAPAVVRLPSGEVLVMGGILQSGMPATPSFRQSAVAETEIYDPSSGAWRLAAKMNVPRLGPNAVLLASGRVLVVAGDDGKGTAEIYDPTTKRWTLTASLLERRQFPAMVTLSNNLVMVVGGWIGPGRYARAAELYDEESGGWTATGPLNEPALYALPIAYPPLLAPLPNGEALIAGVSEVFECEER